MMGERTVAQEALFYELSLERHDRRLLLRHPLRAQSLRRGPSEPGLSLVLPARLEGDVPDHSTFSKNRHGRVDEGVARAIQDLLARGATTEAGSFPLNRDGAGQSAT